jgi:hypothetical protein
MNLSEGAVSFFDLEIDISDSTTVSDAYEFEDGVYLVGIFHPILTTSTELTFLVSDDGVTFVDMFDTDGTRLALTVAPAAAGYTVAPITKFAGVKHLKIEVADAQAADRVFQLAVRGV